MYLQKEEEFVAFHLESDANPVPTIFRFQIQLVTSFL